MRCTETEGLVVTHVKGEGENLDKIGNARVLCNACLEEEKLWGHPAEGDLPPFSDLVKNIALQRAKNRCECIRLGGCH